MSNFDYKKYRPFQFAPKMTNRTWCDKQIIRAPIWCSVDLRDGNQALIDPMTVEQKIRFFKLLVKCGFKEIEIGFPSASQIEYDFTRRLIEENLIPDDVTVQVLTQAREHLIKRTFESLHGAKRAIVHLYNSTSKVQRDKVYRKTREEIKDLAIFGANLLKEQAKLFPDSQWIFEYSPESFSQTEPDYAVEVCAAVCDVWQPTADNKVILNLPNTVECATPNIYADQVEYFCQNIPNRENLIISVHTHNDRGTAVAASELAVMAGADRVEGTLLGNGERTGNMDILVMAMNLYSQGIDPELNFADINEIVHTVSECNNLPVHPRHPYIGELVFTAFSGSHQDAIKKSLEFEENSKIWDIAYLPLDPKDIGRSYQDVVRINSQSGKGGVAYILSRDYGLQVPRWLQVDLAQKVQKESEKTQKELSSQDVMNVFENFYLRRGRYTLHDYQISRQERNDKLDVVLYDRAKSDEKPTIVNISGAASGVLGAFIDAMEKYFAKKISVLNYAQHAMTQSTDAQAVAYVQLMVEDKLYTGIAYSHDTVSAMLRAALTGFCRYLEAN